jgi:hypothetical protein
MASKRQIKLLNYFDVTTPSQSTEESTTSTAEGDVGLEHSSVLTEGDSESEEEDYAISHLRDSYMRVHVLF